MSRLSRATVLKAFPELRDKNDADPVEPTALEIRLDDACRALLAMGVKPDELTEVRSHYPSAPTIFEVRKLERGLERLRGSVPEPPPSPATTAGAVGLDPSDTRRRGVPLSDLPVSGYVPPRRVGRKGHDGK